MEGPWFLTLLSKSLLSSFESIIQRQHCYWRGDWREVESEKRERGRWTQRQRQIVNNVVKKTTNLCTQEAIIVWPVISYAIWVYIRSCLRSTFSNHELVIVCFTASRFIKVSLCGWVKYRVITFSVKGKEYMRRLKIQYHFFFKKNPCKR